MPYVPHTPEDQQEMLEAIGLARLEDLFASIPAPLRLERDLDIPPRRGEAEILREFERLAARNRRLDKRPSFLGAGVYQRFVPAAVDYLSSRGEFNTSYTPYQPEVSQGTLQAIFEYQTLIARLTGMEISNASMYEAGTALAEAALMALALLPAGTARRRVVVSEGVHPEYLATLETYLANQEAEVVKVPLENGVTSPAAVRAAIAAGGAAAFALQSPNFFGVIEDGASLAAVLDAEGPAARPFFIACASPVSLALLAPPGSWGADVAIGDGQELGNYPAYGGPTFGFFATREAHVRKIPGRIVGQTTDQDGRRGYVLTFQTREQHIRRERATSNICTNQGLVSLRAAMHLALLGEAGLCEAAAASVRRAHGTRPLLAALPGVEAVFHRAPFFHEFPLRLPLAAEEAYRRLDEAGIGGGLPLGRYYPGREREMLFSFTEMTTGEDVRRLAAALGAICAAASRPAREAVGRGTRRAT
jgi:glycine dehydrogenase subunit 1